MLHCFHLFSATPSESPLHHHQHHHHVHHPAVSSSASYLPPAAVPPLPASSPVGPTSLPAAQNPPAPGATSSQGSKSSLCKWAALFIHFIIFCLFCFPLHRPSNTWCVRLAFPTFFSPRWTFSTFNSFSSTFSVFGCAQCTSHHLFKSPRAVSIFIYTVRTLLSAGSTTIKTISFTSVLACCSIRSGRSNNDISGRFVNDLFMNFILVFFQYYPFFLSTCFRFSKRIVFAGLQYSLSFKMLFYTFYFNRKTSNGSLSLSLWKST